MFGRIGILTITALLLSACSLDISMLGKDQSSVDPDLGVNFPLGDKASYFSAATDFIQAANGNYYVVDANGANVVILNSQGRAMKKIGGSGSGNGQFQLPMSVVSDSQSNFYIADFLNSRIQKFSPMGVHLENIGTTGTTADSLLSRPWGMAMDSQDNLYVTECQGTTINYLKKYKPNTSTGVYEFDFAKGGAEGNGADDFDCPRGVAVDSNDDIFVVDADNRRVVKIDKTTHLAVSQFGSVGPGNGKFGTGSSSSDMNDIVIDSDDNIYVSEAYPTIRIQKFNSAGSYVADFGSGVGTGDGQLQDPKGLGLDNNGNLLVGDQIQSTTVGYAQIFKSDGTFIAKWKSGGSDPGEIAKPYGVAVYKSEFIAVVDNGNKRASLFKYSGEWVRDFGTFVMPMDIDVDDTGNIYVLDFDGGVAKIYKFDKDGLVGLPWITTVSGVPNTLGMSMGFDVTGSGEVYVAETSGKVSHYDGTGEFVFSYGEDAGTTDDDLSVPVEVAVDSLGRVFVSELVTTRIHAFQPNGTSIATVGTSGSGPSQFQQALGIAVSPTNSIYVADGMNNNIQEFTLVGSVYTRVHGFGQVGVVGGEFSTPVHIVIDENQVLWVADSGNARVQKLNLSGQPVN
ncbi:NHL repeat-containing protein [Bdellovibrio sp. HCB290]|uniref:NHL repeat-containing protein n=1 Tax=Bdellovibrio sp. HCB290 TaxID=3394356 RepID=UPI0039B3FDFA